MAEDVDPAVTPLGATPGESGLGLPESRFPHLTRADHRGQTD